MENKYLARSEAPISAETWAMLDEAMAGAAKGQIAGRRLLHIEGPFGFGLKVVPLEDCDASGNVIQSSLLSLNLIQTTFTLGKRDLASHDRDGLPLGLDGVACAAIECARLEDAIIFEGTEGTNGLLTVEGSGALTLSSWNTVGKAADDIIQAITRLDDAGFHGPYCMALAPSRYNLLFRRYPQGGTELEHISGVVTDGVFKAPGLDKGGVLLASGKQFVSIIMGQDMTVGYIGPVGGDLEFSVSESLALMVRQPAAICALKEK
ncbi:MAG: bacteriocin family protein [Methanoregulaceae archaeon]|nr:bacteriocin family protein [Methanoregulaceae archaeon]